MVDRETRWAADAARHESRHGGNPPRSATVVSEQEILDAASTLRIDLGSKLPALREGATNPQVFADAENATITAACEKKAIALLNDDGGVTTDVLIITNRLRQAAFPEVMGRR